MTPYTGPLLWTDIETTDSEPRGFGAAILEVGMIVTRGPDLTVVGEASLLIRPPGGRAGYDRLWASMPQAVRDMHTANGLWHEATSAPDAWAIHDADTALYQWLAQDIGVLADGPIPLAGAGVGHFDLQWVKTFMPRISSAITYWPLDISPLRRMLEYVGRNDLVDVERDVVAKPHRALADVRLHVAEARRYFDLLASLPTAIEEPAA